VKVVVALLVLMAGVHTRKEEVVVKSETDMLTEVVFYWLVIKVLCEDMLK
jgi:hypothetical protein